MKKSNQIGFCFGDFELFREETAQAVAPTPEPLKVGDRVRGVAITAIYERPEGSLYDLEIHFADGARALAKRCELRAD